MDFYKSNGSTIYEESLPLKNIWLLPVVSFIMFFVFVLVISLSELDWVYFLIGTGVSLIICSFTLFVNYKGAKHVFFRIKSDGIELGIMGTEIFVPFNEILWVGSNKLKGSFARYKFFKIYETVLLYPSKFLVHSMGWSVFFSEDDKNIAVAFYPPKTFIAKMVNELRERGYGHLIEKRSP